MRAILFAAMLTAMASAQQPEMAHLSVTGKQNELALDFVGHTNCSVAWGVQYGTSPDLSAADFHPVYACTDYTASEPGPTFMLRALLTGLVSGTKYYYAACIENSREPCSQIFSFTYDSGANRPGGRAYAVLADFGYYNAESLGKLIGDFEDGRFDMLIHAGDMAYNLQDLAGAVGDGFFRQIQPVVSGLPYHAIPGNHEDFQNFSQYRMRFAAVAENAGVNSGSGSAMFYSFDDGLAHFVMWNSEAWWAQSADSQQAMLNWLAADLAAANSRRSTVPWLISMSHKAWWMDDTLQCPSGAGCVVWQMLEEAGVDIAFVGHIHTYARDAPEYPNANNGTGAVDMACVGNNTGNSTNIEVTYTNPKFMTLIVSGAPGDQEVNRRRLHAPAAGAPNHQLSGTNNYGFSMLTIVNATTLHHRFETAVPHVNSTNPTYTDDLWLVVDSHGPRKNLPPV